MSAPDPIDAFPGRIPDGPLLDRLIGDAMGTPDPGVSLRLLPAGRGPYALTATACLAVAGALALFRRYR